MHALSFRLSGKVAHFRRFYTNSSSLSYPIPPPSTLAGLVGGAMGLAPREYPRRLSGVRFSIQPLTPWRTLLQTVNLLKGKETGWIMGAQGHTQVPIQVIAPRTFDAPLRYEVLMVHEDPVLIKDALDSLRNPVFPPFLGAAYCLGFIDEVRELNGRFVGRKEGPLHGALRASFIEEGPTLKEGQRILRDRYPLGLDEDRRLLEVDDLLLDESGAPIQATYQRVYQHDSRLYALV